MPPYRRGAHASDRRLMRQGQRLLDDDNFRICVRGECNKPDAVVHSALVSTFLSIATLFAYLLADLLWRSRLSLRAWKRTSQIFAAIEVRLPVLTPPSSSSPRLASAHAGADWEL